MKKVIPVVFIMIASMATLFGQAPHAINYQAVARDTTGAILTNQDISVRITILKDSVDGQALYQETHIIEVNSYGLINLAIGTGTVINGDFPLIEWDSSEHFLKVEIDPDAGSNYVDFGTTQLVSVPYALEAKHASSLTLTDENGRRYEISVDTNGNLITEREWLCGDSLVDARDGQVYATVLIGNQCWMAENMNIGTLKIVGYGQYDNDIIEKYCWCNLDYYCEIYGGLYQWNEMMQYTVKEGVQGICPEGWHIPTDAQWMVLEGEVDSSYSVGDTVWYAEGCRGSNAGKNLKSTYGWENNGNGTDLFGFTALPGGSSDIYSFYNIGLNAFFWTSTIIDEFDMWNRILDYDNNKICRWPC